MQDFLEDVRHGTPFYPFEIYHMDIVPYAGIVNVHWHPELEILLIREGRLTVMNNQVICECVPGDLFFIAPEHLHTMHTSKEHVVYEAFLFPMTFLSSSAFDDVQSRFLAPVMQKKLLFPTLVRGNEQLRKLFEQIYEENSACATAYQLATKAMLLQVFCQMFRDGLFLPADEKAVNASDEHLQLLREIVTYLDANYQRPVSLQETSENFHLSPKYFSRFFHQNFGKTFTEYVNDCRILASCELLENTDQTVLAIALSCGFDNVSYFIRRFRSSMGCTPGEYRKNRLHRAESRAGAPILIRGGRRSALQAPGLAVHVLHDDVVDLS